MRRLTEDEQKIVAFINSNKSTEIKTIIRKFGIYDNDITLKVNKDRDYIDVNHKYHSDVEYLSDLPIEKKKALVQSAEDYLIKILEVVQLLTLLKDNNLLYFLDFEDEYAEVKKVDVGKNRKELSDLTIPVYIGEIVIFGDGKTYPFRLKLHHFSNDVYNVTVSNIYPTSALKVYVGSGFRTDEQRHNDNTVRYAKWAIIAAFVAAIASPVITVILDSKDELAERLTRIDFNTKPNKQKNTYQMDLMKRFDYINNNIEGLRNELKATPSKAEKK